MNVQCIQWLNLVLDLSSLVSECWKGQTYKSTESICASANCRLRRIFTMRAQPPDTTDDEGCPNIFLLELTKIA